MSRIDAALRGALSITVAFGVVLAGRASGSKVVAVDMPNLAASAKIAVTSKVMRAGQAIPRLYSSYGKNVAPDLEWSPVPAKARSIAVLVEDPDAPPAKPFVHWVLYNLPPDAHSLPAGKATGGAQPREAKAGRPNTVLEGTNDNHSVGWYGPHPPKGDPPHHYHFQVFALDKMLPVPPGGTRDAVEAAMAGHVVAKGEMVATYREEK